MHDYVPVIILVVGLFAGIWLNRRDFAELKADTNRQFDAVHKRLDHFESEVGRRFDQADGRFNQVDARFNQVDRKLERVDADLREFYGTDKQLEGRLNELSARVK